MKILDWWYFGCSLGLVGLSGKPDARTYDFFGVDWCLCGFFLGDCPDSVWADLFGVGLCSCFSTKNYSDTCDHHLTSLNSHALGIISHCGLDTSGNDDDTNTDCSIF